MIDETTPKDLHRELGVNERTIRAFLRETYPHPLNTRWLLDDEQAAAVRARFEQR